MKLLLKKKQQLMRRHKHRDADLVSSQISALLVSNIISDKKAKGSANWWKKSTPCLVGSRKKYYAFSAEEMNKYCSISTVTNYQDHIFQDCTSSELPQLELHQVYNYLKRVSRSLRLGMTISQIGLSEKMHTIWLNRYIISITFVFDIKYFLMCSIYLK